MTDGIIKGNGNSRYLKTVAEAMALYPTYEDFMAALIAGTLPVDLNGINVAGWSQIGTALNKGNLLKDTTAALFGLDSNAVPDDVLTLIPYSISEGWKKLVEYTTAGAYTWTAPDLFDGKSYKIGVVVIGAGGSGGAVGWTGSSGNYYKGYGGGSGYSQVFTLEVTPGKSYAVVVGAGGVSVTTGSVKADTAKNGNAGGSSSFGGITATGGDSGSNHINSTGGAQISKDGSPGQWGGEILYNSTYGIMGRPDMCFNPFECKKMLGAGGCASGTQVAQGYSGGKDPVTGLGGGDGVIGSGITVTGESATDSGCGGGGASVYVGNNAAVANSGAGADGAVKIYVQGVQQ